MLPHKFIINVGTVLYIFLQILNTKGHKYMIIM